MYCGIWDWCIMGFMTWLNWNINKLTLLDDCVKSSHQCARFSSQPVEIYVNFIRVPSAPLQNFTVHRRFCPSPISSLPRSADFSSCPKSQCVSFVSNTFSCVLSLCINCNFETKLQSCQPISHLEFLNSLFGCLVVGCPKGRYRGTEHRSVTMWYSISQEICTRFLLCCALLWLYIDWFSHIHQAYFTGTVAI